MEEITDIKEVQKIALGILKHIDKICKENNIQYYLAGGTLLGAIRHKGFIPWDDDIDIFMLRPDYERFLKIMDNTKHEQYKCLHYGKDYPNYIYRFAKVVDLNTKVQESTLISHEDMGVFVDVFPIDGINIKKWKKPIRKTTILAKFIEVSACTTIPKTKSKLKYIIKKILRCYTKVFGWKYWLNKHEQYIKKFHNLDNYEHRYPFSGCYKFKDIMPKELYDDIIEVEFEGYKFPAFRNYDYYLSSLYGDYMTPPPPEKRIAHTLKIYKKDKP